MDCGAAATEEAEQCDRCGGQLPPRRLHEQSDVRIEAERIGAVLPEEASPLPDGRWARVSDHPGPMLLGDDSKVVAALAELPHAPAHVPMMFESVVQETHTRASDVPPPPDSHKPASHDIAIAAPPVGASAETSGPVSTAQPSPPPPRTSIASPPLQHALPATNTGAHVVQARRPPVLASEALLRDIAPSRPARRALRVWCPLLGVLGVINVWVLTRGQGLGWPLAGAFCALSLLGLPPMPYSGRASAVTTVSATGLALLLWSDAPSPGGALRIMLTAAVALLGSGLLFRAWHRASALSRFIVASGIGLASLFLWLSGELSDLTLVDTAWQSWLPRVVALAFSLLLLLSLLAFMDARSTGGAAVWAGFILCWMGVHAVTAILQQAWPKGADAIDLTRIPHDTLLAWTSAPLLTALLSIGLAQLMAAGVADATQRRNTTSMRPPPNSVRNFSSV
jgi:hypothetical protein